MDKGKVNIKIRGDFLIKVKGKIRLFKGRRNTNCEAS